MKTWMGVSSRESSKGWRVAWRVRWGVVGGVLVSSVMVAQPSSSSASGGMGMRAPEAGLRDLEADRPDATESPVTVDRGWFQIESSFFSYTRDDSGGTRTEVWGIAESNIKYGLTDSTDLQLVVTPYVEEVTKTGGVKTSVGDVSDLTLRLKQNFWGNDGGETAFALMPFVKVPTNTKVSNGRWEGGLIAPLAWRAGERWGIGLQAEIGRVFNDDDGDMDWEFSHTAVLGLDVSDQIGAYLEYLGVAGDHTYHSFFSGGVTYGLTDRLRLDSGVMVGINDEAEDLTVFSGVTWKF